MIVQTTLFTVFLVGANCFYINQELYRPIAFEGEGYYPEQPLEYVQPVHVRERRQVRGVVNTVPEGTMRAEDNVYQNALKWKRMPILGDQLTVASKFNFLNTDNHDFNNHGRGVDYMSDKNIGASVSAAHRPLLQRTDYSTLGKFNLFPTFDFRRDRTSSLDFSGGATKSMSPIIPDDSWQPTLGLSVSKYF